MEGFLPWQGLEEVVGLTLLLGCIIPCIRGLTQHVFGRHAIDTGDVLVDIWEKSASAAGALHPKPCLNLSTRNGAA